jgi:FKBP-type peptidyl-prolyl cis-trans isomerase (trigger factor)
MKVEQLDDEDGRKVLQIEAPWPEVAADYEDIVSAYATVRVPGFRQGKVPGSVIEGRLQKQILEDFSQRVAQRLGREALRQENIETMGPVELRDIECGKGKPMRFVACFRPMPEIVLPDLGDLYKPQDGSDPRDQISKRLLELVSFNVPDELVRAELGDEDSNGGSGDVAWNAASDRVRLMLILKKIAVREGIEVSNDEVEQRIREKASEFGEAPDSLRNELQKGGSWQKLRDVLLAEGIFSYLMELNQRT